MVDRTLLGTIFREKLLSPTFCIMGPVISKVSPEKGQIALR